MESAPSEISSFNDHPPNGKSKEPFRPFMNLMLLAGPGLQSFKLMKLEVVQKLIYMVHEYILSSTDESSKVLGHVVLIDAYLSVKKYNEALDMCDAALSLGKTAGSEILGASPYLYFMK